MDNEEVKVLIEDHASLVVKIVKLEADVYNEQNADNKVEFANKAVQLRCMKNLADIIETRLENNGVFYDCGEYFTKVGNITTVLGTDKKPKETKEEKKEDK